MESDRSDSLTSVGIDPFLVQRTDSSVARDTNENNLANKSARLSGNFERRARGHLQLSVFKLLFEFVAFLACHFQVEHQVLDVESQLRQGFLDE